ncbi:mitogen-activated protein kinase kinase kinase 20-like [Rosa rugosa]|uniref:mitogen-activated protein kinase kinase kinase 20-like n=1 Tax=Rosa rugosa TaxID=74645 RepID=UPI002B406ADD|nr:mitogen-activated protein kinase kinase kinase 20-like [Rosa rugosa]
MKRKAEVSLGSDHKWRRGNKIGEGGLGSGHKLRRGKKIGKGGLGSGHKWRRGKKIGEGGFGSVFIAFSMRPYIISNHMPKAMAMKSAKIKDSDSIRYELEVFRELINEGGSCSSIIEHYGEEVTRSDEGEEIYNLALEIAWGSLAKLIEKTVHGLGQNHVRRYTRDILKGVEHIHKSGYVHCDLKPDNILLLKNEDYIDQYLCPYVAKVGDLGLAKKEEEVQERWRGTPMYLSPEAVEDNVQERPSDIWAVGCIVLEMLTGECPRNHFYDGESGTLHIVDGMEPKIPDTISSLAKDFLKLCLAEVPEQRWTAEELLTTHPFVANLELDSDN